MTEKSLNIVVLDNVDRLRYYPFNILHPLFELRFGYLTIAERLMHQFPNASFTWVADSDIVASYIARTQTANSFNASNPTVILQAACSPRNNLVEQIVSCVNSQSRITMEGTVVAESLPPMPWVEVQNQIDVFGKESRDSNVTTSADYVYHVTALWDSLSLVGSAIADDIDLLRGAGHELSTPERSGTYHRIGDDVFVMEGAVIGAGCVIDASNGPILIGSNAYVMHNSVLIGPVAIGNSSLVKVGAKIYENTTIGPTCKIGGEIENSIVQGYSNKQHDGFLGHSFLSEWVNLGAESNTSDLKNTYGKVSIFPFDKEIATGRMLLGFLCGDHSKTAINTSINTGTVGGICSNIFANGFTSKFIPSFSFGGDADTATYHFDKAISVAETVMARRDRTLLPEERILLEREFKHRFEM